MRRYQIAVVTCVIVWCSTVVYLFRSQDSISISKQNQLELNRAFASLGELKQQNLQLQWTISKMGLLNNISTSNDDQRKVLMDLQTELQGCLGEKKQSMKRLTVSSNPTKEHETLIKKVNNGVVELLYSIETELKHLEKSPGSQGADVGHALSRLSVQQRSILLDIEDLNRENQFWKENEAKSLRELVQQRINFVQNPKDCKKAKQLVCQLNKGCGFGCQVHHLAYCFMVAYGTQRTLVIESKNWRYEPGGWEVIFQPVSQTCTKASSESSISWRGEEETKDAQVVILPIVDGLPKRPPYLPLGIPEDLAPRLLRLHGNPSVWWVGQFMSYLLRPQKWLQDDLNKVGESFGVKRPVVGIQVRRTDKVGTEAAFHGIEEYMKHVNEWYEKYELRMSKDGTETTRRVYLATDDASVLPEAKKKYPEYEFISDQAISESAGLHSRYTKASLRGVVIDIFLLSKCDYLVCTFSSQVCRVAYELMQNLHPDAAAKFHSLDDVYYYGGQTAHDQVAIYDHKARPGSNEIDLKVGDPVGIAGNHWDGYSKGTNRRTNQVGLYPSFKVVETYTLVKYPTYPEAESTNSNRATLR